MQMSDRSGIPNSCGNLNAVLRSVSLVENTTSKVDDILEEIKFNVECVRITNSELRAWGNRLYKENEELKKS